MWAAIFTYKERAQDGSKVVLELVRADTKEEVEQYLAERPKGYLPKNADVRIEDVGARDDGAVMPAVASPSSTCPDVEIEPPMTPDERLDAAIGRASAVLDAIARTHPSIRPMTRKAAGRHAIPNDADPLIPTQLWDIAFELREAWAEYRATEETD